MSLRSNYADLHMQPPCFPPKRLVFLRRNLWTREPRMWRHRRLKISRKLAVRNQIGPLISLSFENLFNDLISQFPSVDSLDLIAPALGCVSGVALYLSRLKPGWKSGVHDIGEWILFTSPTPFNRFVLLRCPSISFEGSDLLEDVNEKLVKEDRHFVRLDSGRIHVQVLSGKDGEFEEKLVYQRLCVSTDDGGVISLDWPANLDLKEERGMDTTLVLVPGTAEGSMDKNIRSFVCESLKNGCFPVVMNPRGTAGSPLTTARLFTAADSDDICTAIQFISSARPWTTLMGIGWGYGANMLTKYLAEVGEKTPLTAATCIDNPFDLVEATRSSPHRISVDQKLTGGLVDILRSNKELFRGKAKGFNVEKALSARSVCDFENAISMVTCGFESIKEFYTKCSTRELVGNVKIPVLFIQSDDGTVPQFSIPRSLIAENLFTSILLCSCLPSNFVTSNRSAMPWCQQLAIEWLAAVELGLLKGRHPLLKDIDVTINPSKGLALVDGGVLDKTGSVNNLLNLTQSVALNEYPIKETLEKGDSAASFSLRAGQDSQGKRNFDFLGSQPEENGGVLKHIMSNDAELGKEEWDDPVNSERGQVLQTAQVVMNMLDVTMPGTLTQEQKNKVLDAMGKGETLMKALQEAVPEDVRGKLTASVSEILKTQGTNLNLEGLLNIGKIYDVSSAVKLKIQESVGGLSGVGGRFKEQTKKSDDGFDNSQLDMEKSAEGLEPKLQHSQKSQISVDLGSSHSDSSHEDHIISSQREDANAHVEDDFSREKSVHYSECNETGSERGGKPESHILLEKGGGPEEAYVEQGKMNLQTGIGQVNVKDVNNMQNNGEKILDTSTDQNKPIPSSKTDEILSPATSSSEASPLEKEGNDNKNKEEKNVQPMPDQNKQSSTKTEESLPSLLPASGSHSFSVSEALDALTGMDDSTQMAVNSVFGVIESVITELEDKEDSKNGKQYKSEDKNEERDPVSEDTSITSVSELEDKEDSKNGKQYKSEDKNEEPDPVSEDTSITSVSEDTSITSENKLENTPDGENEMSMQSDLIQSQIHTVNDCCEKFRDPSEGAENDWEERKPSQNLIVPLGRKIDNCNGNSTSTNLEKEKKANMKEHLTDFKFLAENFDKLRNVDKIPLCVSTNPYENILYKEYLHKCRLSKISNTKSLDLDTTTALFLDYFPEEGQWKLLDQPRNTKDSVDDITTHKYVAGKFPIHPPGKSNDADKVIEPSYVILDSGKGVGEYGALLKMNGKENMGSNVLDEVMRFIKNIILDSLKVEVGRRLGASDMKEMESSLAQDMEKIGDAVSLAVGHDKEHTMYLKNNDANFGKVGTLRGEHILTAIATVVRDTIYLRKVLPVGVIVGSILSALRKYFYVTMLHDNVPNDVATIGQTGNSGERLYGQVAEMVQKPIENKAQNSSADNSKSRGRETTEMKDTRNDTVMVGAVTAVLGASALLVHQQTKDLSGSNESAEVSSKSDISDGNHQKDHNKLERATSEKCQDKIVDSLAEKAMSVAGPVVPTKNDGEVDQERLVAMLADLGQKGGILRSIGKIALFWGGIRGALSLTDKLISFLNIAKRPLFQRILCFVCMVLVLWTPVVVPLFPALVRGWAAHNSSGFAEFASIIGLYAAAMLLVMLWGKRIRGYGNALEKYGLEFTSLSKLHDFLKGLILGVMLVLSIHSVPTLLGCVCLTWPVGFSSSSSDAMMWLKEYGRILILAGRGIITATGVAVVEELLFRSWLPEEIAVDLGYHWGIIISGFAFSVFQRSPHAIPGLWLLSLVLAGLRQRSNGSLSIPIGFHAGIMASSFILQTGGFLTYRSNAPLWLTGIFPFQPLSGVVGLGFSLLLAIVLYPRQFVPKNKITSTIRE